MTKTSRTPVNKGAHSVKASTRTLVPASWRVSKTRVERVEDNETYILAATLPIALLLTFGGSYLAAQAEAGVGPESSTGTFLYILSQLLCVGGFIIAFITLCVIVGLIIRITYAFIRKQITPKRIATIKAQAKLTAASVKKARHRLSM